ncbi:hypothetical protein HPB49_003665 [Dermacentor silvarum]|uniref:Uncharacterized protein n=1 Tax=Dermacentor silvarum TaxID=543639 RepID=A0ACB8CV05_DERSI|nr:hypothetical protein HPB49_003665 [Dermacentor silvarum]
MSHILVKWVTEDAWDVYPVRAIERADIGFRLLTEEGSIRQLRGSIFTINWESVQQPAEAELLDLVNVTCGELCAGSQKGMERKRAQLAKASLANKTSDGAGARTHEEEGSKCNCSASKRILELEAQVKDLEGRLQESNNNYESLTLVRKSRKLVQKLENLLDRPMKAEAEAEKARCLVLEVNIGGGVLVEKSVLDRRQAHCHGLPTKFERNLLRHVFREAELQGKILYGKGTNRHKEDTVKEGLDPVRLNAVIGYTCSKFTTTTVQLKSSLSSMLSREIK